MKFFRKSKDVNMTEGSIIRLILAFTLPLVVGNFFQLLYNTVDAWVLGNYVSDEAFGAVGSLGAIINMILCLTQGMSVGASALVSQYYGASENKKLSAAVHTSVILTVSIGIVATIFGVLFTDTLLELIKIPEEMTDEASLYLKIYLGGILGVMLYNIFAAILRSVGDSQTPFWALVIASIINLVLDLVLVLCFEMQVEGVAIATVIAQFISVVFLAVKLVRAKGAYRLSFKGVSYSSDVLWTMVKIGLPSAIQLGVTAFSNVFVQSYINNLGPSIVSGWSSYSKIDQFLLLPIQSVSIAATTFVGQNIGAGKKERAKKGILVSILMTGALLLVLLIPIMIFAEPLTRFFNKEADIVKYGAYILRLVSPFYLFVCVNNIIAGALRGSGNTKAPTAILLFSFVAFRQCYLAIVNALGYGENLTLVALAYPFGWIIATVIMLIYFKYAKWDKGKVTGEKHHVKHHWHIFGHHSSHHGH